MRETFSPKQVARAIGVSDASLKRWCDRGLLECHKTVGGHRRITLASVIEFLQKDGRPLVRPEILGLPSNAGTGPLRSRRAREEATEALERRDSERFEAILWNLFISGLTIAQICDEVLAPAYNYIGDLWSHGKAEIYMERHAGEICQRALHVLANALPVVEEDAPKAAGASSDAYSLPTKAVESVLRQERWNARSYGNGLPLENLMRSIHFEDLDLFWLSVSHLGDEATFLEAYDALYRQAEERSIPVIVGGRALHPELRAKMRFAAHCDTLSHLVGFVRSWRQVNERVSETRTDPS